MTDEIPPQGLADLLTTLVEMQRERAVIEADLKRIDKSIERLEALAAEQLGASGLDGCRVAGKSWRIEESLYLSVSREHRKEVLAAAAAEGLNDAIAVNTATLKGWLVGRAKEHDLNLEDAVSGTAFDGLISQCVRVRLRSLTTG